MNDAAYSRRTKIRRPCTSPRKDWLLLRGRLHNWDALLPVPNLPGITTAVWLLRADGRKGDNIRIIWIRYADLIVIWLLLWFWHIVFSFLLKILKHRDRVCFFLPVKVDGLAVRGKGKVGEK